MIGVAIGTMALIVVLSVFNGLEDVLRSVYQTFDPDLKIESVKGKSFEVTNDFINTINQVPGVDATAQVIEDNALVSYREQQVVVRIKGIEESYLKANKLDTFLVNGELKLRAEGQDFAILGAGVAYELGILLDNDNFKMEVVYPKNVRPGVGFSASAVRRVSLKPSGVFSVEQAYDESLIMTSLDAAKRMLSYKNQRTSVEVYIQPDASLSRIKREIEDILGDDFKVSDSDEQHAELLKAVKIEKLFVYIALTFITLIASFNIFFSLSMLAIEKRRDMSVLFAFGATKAMVKGIFLKQGIIIAMVGSVLGLLLGLFICWIQQTYELVSLGLSNAVSQAYPVKIIWTDFLMVGLSITIITILTAYRPAALASKVDPIAHLN